MFSGSSLTFDFTNYAHNVKQLLTETDFNVCNARGEGAKSPILFPRTGNGFQVEKSPYYIVCPVSNHCDRGMKIKICVKKMCSGLKTCEQQFSII